VAAFLHIISTSRLLSALRHDKRAIFQAATAAQAASNFILAAMDADEAQRAAA
jgi:antirestriction protein ArdC